MVFESSLLGVDEEIALELALFPWLDDEEPLIDEDFDLEFDEEYDFDSEEV